MKKSLIFITGLLLSWSASAVDFGIRAMPSFSILSECSFDSGVNVTGALDFSPFTVRGRDQIYLSAQAGLIPLKAAGIEDSSFYDLGATLGYNCTITDRLSVFLEGGAGVWSVSDVKGADDQELGSASGPSYGGRGGVYFNILPELSAGAFGGYRIYSNGSENFMTGLDIGLALRYSFKKGLFSTSDVKFTDSGFEPLFPVFYSRYEDHSFGTLAFVNNEKNDITDVEVSIFIEQYMSIPSVCKTFPKIKRGEVFTAEITAFLDETILANLIAAKADAKIAVRYKSLGKKVVNEQIYEVQTLSRNSMTWEDDRRAAAFVSGRDGSASFFANYVRSIVKNEFKQGIPENIQYAAGLFAALKEYGINYVVDPSSAFTDNTGTTQVDFLQFPYQTLLYHGGDCDDLSILNCALFEALGIETAFITVPGHIYIAFDSGVTEENMKQAGDCVVQDGKVWVPLEITVCQDTFGLERSIAMREWKKYPEERALIPLRNAWQEYKAVGIPDSSVKLEMPAKAKILKTFKSSL